MDDPASGRRPDPATSATPDDPARGTHPPGGRSEMTAEELLAALGQAVIATTPDGTVAYWNPAAERMYGWSAEEALGRNIAEVTVPEMSQTVADDIMAALRAGIAWSGGFPVRRRDGTMFPALVTDSGIYRGDTLVGIVGVSANLGTALRPLLERSSDAAIVLTAGAVITYASPAVTSLFAWEPAELVGTSLSMTVHPDDQLAFAEHLRKAAAPGPYPVLEVRVKSDSTWTWADLSLTNLLDDPVVRGVIVNLRRSVRREAQEAAEERAAQLSSALESRVVVEQAKGFLVCATGMTPDQAFQSLRRYARSRNLTAHEVARQIVAGELPPDSLD